MRTERDFVVDKEQRPSHGDGEASKRKAIDANGILRDC